MNFLLLILLSLSPVAHASLPELFGSSAGSSAVGNQAQKNSAANNYHASALQGFAQTTQFSFNTFYVDTKFNKIKDVLVENQMNSVNSSKRGNVDVNPEPTAMFGMHFSTPLFAPEGPKFNFSFFAPFDRLMETDSGDAYQPLYVMYNTRYVRPIIMLSMAQSFGNWSYSGGVHTGFQSGGESYFVTRTSSGAPSVGKINFSAKPSIAAIASIAKKSGSHTTYLAYQQEMKSNLENRATGETEIASNTSFQFDFDIATLLFYDPTTVRLGHQIDFNKAQLYLSVEYQQWMNFQSSTLKFKKNAGAINGSQNFEKLVLKDIIVPKFGLEFDMGEHWIGKLGYFYRESPIETRKLKKAGNSIDVDKHVASAGLGRRIKFYDKDLVLDVAYQAHLLRNMKIIKTPDREDGDPSESKIGSPGYRVGGMIHVVSMGLSWMY